MKVFLERSFNGLYKAIRNPNERKFVFYSIIYGSKRRYEEKKMNFLNYNIRVPDALSFIWQFKEIFVDEYYKFESELTEPVIYDCGSNIGMSCIYFKRIFPGAKVKAFEADPKISKYLKE
ncbi:MAG: FkbM family methyltransferase, partial [Ignavibacteria bacterium]|nr:FkbM family methyltransferase [Ignavibacteria bacterium]